jgi:membrane peptidoglycan carboxypeptidase
MKWTGRAARLVWFGVLAGILIACAAVPAGALAGYAARAEIGAFETLPQPLHIPADAQATRLYARDGTTLLATFYAENRTDVALAQVSPAMRQAVLAAEDVRFYEHGAVDIRSIARAFVVDLRGAAPVQGASTLTMQYVRNIRKEDPSLTPQQRRAATADTLLRKLTEIRYAVALEHGLSKNDILQRYLNTTYFGAGAYGVDAASHTYFGRPPDDLTVTESALLAGLLQAPDADNPLTGDRDRALTRRAYVLDAMARAGDISPSLAARLATSPLGLHPAPTPNGCVQSPAAASGAGFFCAYLRQWWDAQPTFGATPAERDDRLLRGGYTVVTSLDPRVQAEALRQARSVYGYHNPRALPLAVVEPGTGRVRALAVNRRYSLAANPAGQRDYPNTVEQLVAGGGPITGYRTGSTFKLFTLLAALSAGLPLDTSFDAPARLITRWPDTGPDACGGRYCPANANPPWMDGRRTMWDAFGRSVNTYYVWLESKLGPPRAVAMAQRLGITFRAASDARMAATSAAGWGAFTLGVTDTTPLDLAEAYATIAADGVYCRPLPVESVTDADGRQVPVGPQCTQAVDPDVAHAAADVARCPVGQQSYFGRCDGGTAESVAAIFAGRPVAGKTGSSQGNATETFVAIRPQLVAAGTAADPADPRDRVGAAVSFDVDRAVATTLAYALAGQPWQSFPPPSTAIAFGHGRGRHAQL